MTRPKLNLFVHFSIDNDFFDMHHEVIRIGKTNNTRVSIGSREHVLIPNHTLRGHGVLTNLPYSDTQ